jgi:cyclopropane fatty-acyl-phospholipid synthase-like methyltransferase
MLAMAQVGPNDFVIDLGSGDGRIVILAAQRFGARGFGVDLNPDMVRFRAPRATGARRTRKFTCETF